MSDKLTDNEIIKALKCCIKAETVGDCEEMECPLSIGNCQGCKYVDNENGLYKDALDLINRQKAEIERLEKGELRKAMTFNSETIKNCTYEAYKEFAERLTDTYNFVTSVEINNLLKEMIGK